MNPDKLTYYSYSTTEAEDEFFNAMPQEIFKYRNWSDDFHKTILTKHELFMASPTKFNDPYDCGLPFNQDPGDWDTEKIKSKVDQTAPRRYPELIGDRTKMEEICAKHVMLILQNPKEWFKINYGYKAEDLSQLFGVISLTPHPDNFLLWSHYANSHNGFCVGFNTRKLVKQHFGQFMAVRYCDDIPFISIFDDYPGLMNKLIYVKSNIWSYENEYRITGAHKPNCIVRFSPDTLSSIYFGNKMTYDQKMTILNLIRENPDTRHVRIYEMNLGNKSFHLEPFSIF